MFDGIANPDGGGADALEHSVTRPEERRAAFDLLIGERVNLKEAARVTPAGSICARTTTVAILVAAINHFGQHVLSQPIEF